MDPTVTVAILALIEGVGVAIIGGFFAKSKSDADAYRSKREAQEAEERQVLAERNKRREERDAAILALNFACAEGTEVLLEYAHGEKMNGNVDDALRSISAARKRLNDFINKEAVKL